MLFKLRTRQRRTGVPISIILDNAGYQACYLVRGIARMMDIDLVFLPPYSPNLNLIERLWKHIKQRCMVSQNYNTFEEFCNAVQEAVEGAHIRDAKELDSLLAWNFQTLSGSKVRGSQLAA